LAITQQRTSVRHISSNLTNTTYHILFVTKCGITECKIQLTATPWICAQWTAAKWSNNNLDISSSDKTVPHLQ